MAKQAFQQVFFNLKPTSVRHDTLADKDYLVVPMVMLTVGVHAGSAGPYYYNEDNLSRRPELWNHKPVVVYHPDSPSACTPDILNARQVGVIMNTKWDRKGKRLCAEAWIDEERAKKVDNRVMEAIDKQEMLELSTGLFADSDDTPGTWKNSAMKVEDYQGTLTNYGPDHLAILPDQEGACSTADGAGFFRNQAGKEIQLSPYWMNYFNELSQNAIRDQLAKALFQKDDFRYVEDVFDTYFIWSGSKGLFQQDYEKDGDQVMPTGIPVAVVRKYLYEPVRNDNRDLKVKGNRQMDTKKLVDALIANEQTLWGEKDMEYLNGLGEEVLTKMQPKAMEPEGLKDQGTHTYNAENADGHVHDVQNGAPAKPMTEEQYLAAMPQAMQAQWKRLKNTEQKQKDASIEVILANKANTFTKDFLNTKDVEELENMARLAKGPEDENIHQTMPRFNYSMQGDPAKEDSDAKNLPVLDTPTITNFGRGKAKTAAA
jgi:hypothetical protein